MLPANVQRTWPTVRFPMPPLQQKIYLGSDRLSKARPHAKVTEGQRTILTRTPLYHVYSPYSGDDAPIFQRWAFFKQPNPFPEHLRVHLLCQTVRYPASTGIRPRQRPMMSRRRIFGIGCLRTGVLQTPSCAMHADRDVLCRPHLVYVEDDTAKWTVRIAGHGSMD